MINHREMKSGGRQVIPSMTQLLDPKGVPVLSRVSTKMVQKLVCDG